MYLIDAGTSPDTDKERMTAVLKYVIGNLQNISRTFGIRTSNPDITIKAIKYGDTGTNAELISQERLLSRDTPDSGVLDGGKPGGKSGLPEAIALAQSHLDEMRIPTLLVIHQTNAIPNKQVCNFILITCSIHFLIENIYARNIF